MSEQAATSNKMALLSFGAVLMIFLVIVDVFMIIEEREYLLELERRHAEQELDMMGKLLTEAMIRNDYVTVEQYVPQWAVEHRNIIEVRVIAPNGFEVAQFKRNSTSEHIYQSKKQIDYLGRQVLSLEMRRDLSGIDKRITERMARLVGVSVLAVAVLGVILWRVLKRSAITPLQTQIEERKRMEVKLEEHARELALHVDELESYSYSIAHDLRSPVRSITSFSQVLLSDLEDKLEAQDKDALNRVVEAGKYMAELIDDILALSRITRESMRVEVLDLSAMAKKSITQLQQLEPGRKCEIDIQAGLSAKGDPRLVQLLLDNLLGNAWKYTGEKQNAIIKFGVYKNNRANTFYVQDNGVGFDMQYAGKLFQPFQRLHTREEFEGTGVGLATVQRIVNRHGGKVWAESEVNDGATFYFTLNVVL